MFAQYQDVTVLHTHKNAPLRGLCGIIVDRLIDGRYVVALYNNDVDCVRPYSIHQEHLAHSDCFEATRNCSLTQV